MPFPERLDQGIEILQPIGPSSVEVVCLNLTEVGDLIERVRTDPQVLRRGGWTEQSLIGNLDKSNGFADHCFTYSPSRYCGADLACPSPLSSVPNFSKRNEAKNGTNLSELFGIY